MPRIYLPSPRIINNQITITGEKAHYLTSVLRCGKGDDLIIFDGKDNSYKATIIKAGKREIIANVTETFSCSLESRLDITLVQCLLKGEKMDTVIQKTTELGVKEIIPLISERSQLKDTSKIDRWKKVAEEAARQCGRSVVPVIHEPGRFKELLAGEGLKGFIFYEDEGISLKGAIKKMQDAGYKMQDTNSVNIIIGPEGGFTREEITLAKEKGLFVVSLGKRILRAETAAISAVTLIQFLLGDMG